VNITRRTALKASAWSVPVIAVAVSTPLAAASTTPETRSNRLRFTNVTATVGKSPNTIYANTKVQVIDGPDAVENVVIVVSISAGGSLSYTFPYVGGWGNTDQVYPEFRNVPKGEPVTVSFFATADGCEPISASVQVVTPSWWQ
jgi:hypothetical protein